MGYAGFAMVHHAVSDDVRLSAQQRAVYLALARHAYRGDVTLSRARLARLCGLSAATVHRAVRVLRDYGYLRWHERLTTRGGCAAHCYTLPLLAHTPCPAAPDLPAAAPAVPDMAPAVPDAAPSLLSPLHRPFVTADSLSPLHSPRVTADSSPVSAVDSPCLTLIPPIKVEQTFFSRREQESLSARDTPDEPDTPDAPDGPDAPHMADGPDAPDAADMAEMADAPDEPDTPDAIDGLHAPLPFTPRRAPDPAGPCGAPAAPALGALYAALLGHDPPRATAAALQALRAELGEDALAAMMRESADSTGAITPASLEVARRKLRGARLRLLPRAAPALFAAAPTPALFAAATTLTADDGDGVATSADGGDEAAPAETNPIWRAVLAELRHSLTAENYRAWLASTRVIAQDQDALTIAVSSPFHAHWLSARLKGRVDAALARLGYADLAICYALSPAADQARPPDQRPDQRPDHPRAPWPERRPVCEQAKGVRHA